MLQRPTDAGAAYAWIDRSEGEVEPYRVGIYTPKDDGPPIGEWYGCVAAADLERHVIQGLELAEARTVGGAPQEEALTQIQHIAHDGLVRSQDPEHAARLLKDTVAKLERINNIAEGQRPDEDWQPIAEDEAGDVVSGGDKTITHGNGFTYGND
jgi:hypothetical protein